MDKNIQQNEVLIEQYPDVLKKLTDFEVQEQTSFFIKQQSVLYLFLGCILKHQRDDRNYKKFGDGGYSTWPTFLMSVYKLKEVTANLYVRVYEYYVEKLKMTQEEVVKIPLGILNMLKPKLELMTEAKRDEFIEKAKYLSEGDLRKELIGEKLLDPPKFRLYKCPDCQKYRFEYIPEAICACPGITAIKTMVVHE